jgi:hypothetical protein
LAYGLWWISDRLVSIGPLDRAAFGWAVVIPVWLAAPVVAGFAWTRLTGPERRVAAVAVGTAVGLAAATLFWSAIAFPDCQYGATLTPGDWVPSSLVIGGAIGGGVAFSGLVASRFASKGWRWRAAAVGACVELAMVFAAIFVAASVLMTGGCQRPLV